MAVHLWGVDLREASAGGGEVAAGESRDLPVGLIAAQGEDNKGVCVGVAVVQGLEAASGD